MLMISLYPRFLTPDECGLLEGSPEVAANERLCLSDDDVHPLLWQHAHVRRLAQLRALNAPAVVIADWEAKVAAGPPTQSVPRIYVYPRDEEFFPRYADEVARIQTLVRLVGTDSPLARHLLSTPHMPTTAGDSHDPVAHALFCAADHLSQADQRVDQDTIEEIFARLR